MGLLLGVAHLSEHERLDKPCAVKWGTNLWSSESQSTTLATQPSYMNIILLFWFRIAKNIIKSYSYPYDFFGIANQEDYNIDQLYLDDVGILPSKLPILHLQRIKHF